MSQQITIALLTAMTHMAAAQVKLIEAVRSHFNRESAVDTSALIRQSGVMSEASIDILSRLADDMSRQ